VFNFMFVLS